jgi:prepilin-type N-terminal cleavage/methylation domain-containing protein
MPRRAERGVTMPRRAERGVTMMEILIVLVILSLLAGVSFPAVSAGLDSIRMRSAADSIAGIFTEAVNRAERTQEPLEVVISPADGTVAIRGLRTGFERDVRLPDGITVAAVFPRVATLEPEQTRSLLVIPGATFPRIAIEIANRRQSHRLIQIDPMTGMPVVTTLDRNDNAEDKLAGAAAAKAE